MFGEDLKQLKVIKLGMVYYCILDIVSQRQVVGILHHAVNEHEWLNVMKCCDHKELTGPPMDPDGIEMHYFNQNEPAFRVLCKIVNDDCWLKPGKIGKM